METFLQGEYNNKIKMFITFIKSDAVVWREWANQSNMKTQ